MLYDNAQLAVIYMDAAAALSRPDYLSIASNTLDFLQREFMTADGALISSLSAIDDKDIEGGYYLWTEEQLQALLDEEEMNLVREWWVGTTPAHFDAGHLPVLRHGLYKTAELPAEKKKVLESARKKMLAEREKNRVLPKDDKLLAGWNGLALTAFSRVAKHDGNPSYRKTAIQVARFIQAQLWDGEKLYRARKGTHTMGRASLADYAYVAEGFWHLYQLTGERQYRDYLQQLISAAWARFHTPAGWVLGGSSPVESSGRQGMLSDGPLASPSSILLRVSHRLGQELPDDDLLEQVENALGYDVLSLNRDLFWYASQVRVIADVFGLKSEN
jgi:uncharacterized protein YyaL (SSP411 family)